jgi:hypothetical protein
VELKDFTVYEIPISLEKISKSSILKNKNINISQQSSLIHDSKLNKSNFNHLEIRPFANSVSYANNAGLYIQGSNPSSMTFQPGSAIGSQIGKID